MVHVFGHVPQELMKQKFYSYIAVEDRETVKAFMEDLIRRKTSEMAVTDVYHIVARNGSLVPVISAMLCFYNPVAKNLEYIVVQSCVDLYVVHLLFASYFPLPSKVNRIQVDLLEPGHNVGLLFPLDQVNSSGSDVRTFKYSTSN